MRFRSFVTVLAIRVLIGILLLQLVDCGNSTSAEQTSVGQTPVSTPTSTSSDDQSPPASLLSPNPSGEFDIPGVFHIKPVGTLSCSVNNFARYPVLATNRLTYDTGEISQMATYFDSLASPDRVRPDTLFDVAGGFLGDIPNWDIVSSVAFCGSGMEITNIGQSSIEIAQMGMKFTGDSQLNNYQYHLIDICSLPLNDKTKGFYCPPGRGGTGTPYQYHYNFVPGQNGMVVLGQANQQPILNPGDTIEIHIFFTEAKSSGSHIYSLMPELTLNTSSQQGEIVDLSQLSSVVAFLDPYQQLSCYQLHGNTFVSLSEGSVLPPETKNESPDKSVFCL